MEESEPDAELDELAMEEYDSSGLFCVNGLIPEYEEVCKTVDIRQECKQQGRRRGFVDGGSMVTSTNDRASCIVLRRLVLKSFLEMLARNLLTVLKDRDSF